MNKSTLRKAVVVAIPIIAIASLIMYGFWGKNPHKHIFVRFIDDVKRVVITKNDRARAGNSAPNALMIKMFKNETKLKKDFPLARVRKKPLGEQNFRYRVKDFKIKDVLGRWIMGERGTYGNVAPQSDYQKRGARGTAHYKFMYTRRGPKAKIVCIPQNLKQGPAAHGYNERFPHSFPLTTRTSRWGTIVYKCYVTGDNPIVNSVFDKKRF